MTCDDFFLFPSLPVIPFTASHRCERTHFSHLRVQLYTDPQKVWLDDFGRLGLMGFMKDVGSHEQMRTGWPFRKLGSMVIGSIGYFSYSYKWGVLGWKNPLIRSPLIPALPSPDIQESGAWCLNLHRWISSWQRALWDSRCSVVCSQGGYFGGSDPHLGYVVQRVNG